MAAPGGFYAPGQDQGYPPPQQGYPPAGQGYPPPQQGYPPPQQGYPPPQNEYQPVMTQPGAPLLPTGAPQFSAPVQAEDGAWMGPVAEQMVPLNCPPGLEYLTLIDQLIVKQKVEAMEAVAGVLGYNCETKNKYKIKNVLGQNVFKAKEDTDCCTRYLCGPLRSFDMIIKDNADQEVLHLQRPYRCQSCCFPCCLQELEVSSPPGTVIGYVKQNWTCLKPKFTIYDADDNEVLVIVGPMCTFSMCGDVEFKIMTTDEENEIGKISKQWSGMLKEAFTDTDNFGINFPMDLDVKCKATLLGALFLIDYMFFEKKGNQESDGFGV